MTSIDITRFTATATDTALVRAAKAGSLAGIRHAQDHWNHGVVPTFIPETDDDETMPADELASWTAGFTNWSTVRWHELHDAAILAD